MSTSACYSFIPTPTGKGATSRQAGAAGRNHPLTIADLSAATTNTNNTRQAAISPSSFATSSSTSSSSLNQFSSLTPTVASSSASYSATSSASSTSSSSSSSSSFPSSCSSSAPLSICSTAVVRSSNCEVVGINHHDEAGLVQFQQERHHHHQRERQRRSSVTPVQATHQQHQHHRQTSQLIHSYTLHSLEPKPLKPFKSSSDYLEAMKEDLSEWLNRLYPDLDLSTENFFNQLETGSIICRHANNVTQMGRNFMVERQQQRDNSNDSNQELNNNNNLTSSSTSNSSSGGSGSNSDRDQDSSINSLYSDKSQPILVSCNHLTSSMINVSARTPGLDSRGNINWFRVKTIPFKLDARPGTFFARDNICQFILWCRSLNILECLLFETDDLVARKNEKSFILCLLEVARIGFKVGMPTPLIIQLEQEIDMEIENEAKLKKKLEEEEEKRNRATAIPAIDSHSEDCDDNGVGFNKTNGLVDKLKDEEASQNALDELKNDLSDEEDFGPKPQVITNDLLSLHEKVVQLLCQCTCPTQFPMVRVGDNGKYKVGDKLIIFVRILRRHIMVRVGGGWQELSEFLRVKDPCRSKLYQPNNHHNHLYQQQNHNQVKLASHSSVSKSRLVESSHHLNKALGHHNYRNGQRMISGSASMSWLSHNS